MTINEERIGQIDFSDPYFIAQGRILVKSDNDEITSVDDLAGKSVCTALGSTYEATLKKQAPDAKLKLVDGYSECLELIQNGAVDAVSTDDVILTGMIIQDDTLKLVGRAAHQRAVRRRHQEGRDRGQDVRGQGVLRLQVGRALDRRVRHVDRQVHR